MANEKDAGDKTEKPTPKKLQDARKHGQVAKSREVSSTAVLLMWYVLAAAVTGLAATRLGGLIDATLQTMNAPFDVVAAGLGRQALEVLLALTALTLLPVALFGLLVEFLQAGPVLSMEPVKPKLEHLNPASGIKRMFSLDSLVEVLKAAAKTALLLLIGWWVVRAFLPQIALLARADVGALERAFWALTQRVLVWTIAVFALVAAIDVAWQRHSFTKKLRMSRRDIQQEVKDSEGDPYLKAQRKQTHQEWAQRNAAEAARQASVLVVNPTHVAIAIEYDRERTVLPLIAAKGEDEVARAMREAAQEAGVPIVRNVELARDLLARGEVGEAVPRDLFDLVAEVILWAREVHDAMERERRGEPPVPPRYPAPGEDLSARPR